MGAYLSEPITRKETSSEENDLMSVASCSMQGWRVSQEDAHNAILEFDKDSSLFAVFDGHGGHEVAKYCSLKLPDFIKSKDDYKNGDIDKALVDAFVDFDKTLVTREIVNELKKIAGTECDDEEHDPAEVDNLYEEATMPIEDVMAKYGREPSEVTNGQKTKKQGESSAPKKPLAHPAIAELSKKGRKPISPYLRGKSVSRLDGVAKKSGEISDDGDKQDTATTLKELSESQNDEVFSVEESKETSCKSDASKDTKLKSDQVTPKSDESDDSKPKSEESSEVKPESIEVKAKSEDSTESGESVDVKPEKLIDEISTTKEKTSKLSGEPSQDEKSNNTLATSEASNGHSEESENPIVNGTTCISIKGKGKGKGKSSMAKIVDQVKSDDLPCPKENVEKKRSKSAAELYQNMLVADSDGDDEDLDDDEDENFGESEDDSDDYEDMESDEDDDEEEDEDTEEEDEEEVNGETFGGNFNEEPGNDSGCTAVVALIRGNELYVANAGDSRCIVCRDGKAVDMSEDHKPEDAPEMSRIEKAGGHVTPDGRVNGGLNLSRALGDHAYKNNPYLPLTEQMISPVPDIRRLTLDPSRDSYVFLACDGIWNSLSSQETVDFINERLQKKENVTPKFLETICEELFEHCLAQDTLGDGTGCDNMTAVLVKLKPALSKTKRTAMEDDDDESSQVAKKPKLDIDTEEEGRGSSVKQD